MPDAPARYAVFGNPVSHSWSPLIHAEFARQLGHSIRYEAVEIEPSAFESSVREFFESGGSGLNITLPFKTRAFDLSAMRSERAGEAGAANTLLLRDGVLQSDNTDGVGLVADLQRLPGAPLAGTRVLVLGAGGAVRGVLGELLRAGCSEIHIANRTAEKAQSLAGKFGAMGSVRGTGLNELDEDPAFDWVINGTSASLGGQAPDIPRSCIGPDTACYDMVYGSDPTAFMRWCEAAGASRVYDGLGMLVGQAAESFALWRGVRPDPAPVIELLRSRLVQSA